ncbi:MAG: aldo/keto reductase [Halanaeroarchaeum sp.]
MTHSSSTAESGDDSIPELGIGTWENTDPKACRNAVKTALETGYRHVDTAQAYGNEAAVGDGIEAADVPREEVFLATKVWIDSLAPGDVRESTKASLERLGVDSVDLMYVHWPAGAYDPETTLPAFQELYDEGLIGGIGVSNFEPRHLDEASDVLDVPIRANQVEIHPLLQQRELREYADRHDLALVAYSPLARGAVFEHPVIQDIAETHERSEAQVSLAWLRQKELIAIPKATSEDHIRDNWASLDLTLTGDEMERIDAIDREVRQVDPTKAPW